MLTCRPLLAVTAAGITSLSIASLLSHSYGGTSTGLPSLFLAASGLLLLVIDCWLGQRWLPHNVVSGSQRVAAAPPAAPALPLASYRSAFWHLLWLQWRSSRTLLLCLTGLGLLVLCVFVMPRESLWPLTAWPLTTLGAIITLLGVTTFREDQRGQRFRFLCQLGARPWPVWISRQLPAAIAALLLTLLAAALPQVNSVALAYPQITVLLAGLLAFTVGQLCSLLLHSTILSVAFSLIITGLLTGWLVIVDRLQMPVLLCICPLIAAMLYSTWLRVPTWLTDKNGVRHWAGPVAVLLVTFLSVPAAAMFYRIYQVPYVTLPFSIKRLQEPFSTAAIETADIYQLAFDRITDPPSVMSLSDGGIAYGESEGELSWESLPRPLAKSVADWALSNTDAIALLTEASERAECEFPSRFVGVASNTIWEAAQLLIADAQRLEESGELEQAWDRYRTALRMARHAKDRRSGTLAMLLAHDVERRVYARLPHWAARPGQQQQLVQSAAEWLDQYRLDQPPRTQPIEGDYLWASSLLDENVSAVQTSTGDAKSDGRIALIRELAPWEIERAKRLLRAWTAAQWQVLARNRRADVADAHELATLAENTFLLSSGVVGVGAEMIARAQWDIENQRRAVVYQLALIAYRIANGEYPDSPRDVRIAGRPLSDDVSVPEWSQTVGTPYSYRRTGLQDWPGWTPDITIRDQSSRAIVSPDTPVVWSSTEAVSLGTGEFLVFPLPKITEGDL